MTGIPPFAGQAEQPPIPVAIVVDETEALKAGIRRERRHELIGYVVLAIAGAPLLGLAARLWTEWAAVGWDMLEVLAAI